MSERVCYVCGRTSKYAMNRVGVRLWRCADETACDWRIAHPERVRPEQLIEAKAASAEKKKEEA